MKITKIKEDITSEIANSFKNSIAIDTEATGLQIPERDKLSLIQICDEKGNVYIIQPNKEKFKERIDGVDPGAPNNPKILKKFLITTIITSIIFIVIYYLVEFDLLNLRKYLQ